MAAKSLTKRNFRVLQKFDKISSAIGERRRAPKEFSTGRPGFEEFTLKYSSRNAFGTFELLFGTPEVARRGERRREIFKRNLKHAFSLPSANVGRLIKS